jgi:hypothetical protein
VLAVLALTVPLRVAVETPIFEAGSVVTVGGSAAVVNTMSFPFVVPREFVALARKW